MRYISILVFSILLLGCKRLDRTVYYLPASQSGSEIQEKNSPLKGLNIKLLEPAEEGGFEFIVKYEKSIPPLDLPSIRISGPPVSIVTNLADSEAAVNAEISIPLDGSKTKILFIGQYNETLNYWNFIPAETSVSSRSSVTFRTSSNSIFVPLSFDHGNMDQIMDRIENDTRFTQAMKNAAGSKARKNEGSKIMKELELLESMYLQQMEEMVQPDPGCQDTWDCDQIYEDLPNTLYQDFAALASEKILVEAVLEGTEAATTRAAYALGGVVADKLIIECISCFLPNSVSGVDWWSKYIKYHAVSEMGKELRQIRSELDDAYLGLYGRYTRFYKKNGQIYMSFSEKEEDGYLLEKDHIQLILPSENLESDFSVRSEDFGSPEDGNIQYYAFREDPRSGKYVIVQYPSRDYYTERLFKMAGDLPYRYDDISCREYEDPEGGFEYVIPDIFQKCSESVSPGDYTETVFISKDRKAELIFRVENSHGKPDFQEYIRSRDDILCTYKAVRDDWFVITGYYVYDNDMIFYQKALYSKMTDKKISFMITYPAGLKEKYTDMTTQLSWNFKLMN